MANFMDKISDLNLSRRSFIKASTAAAASLSLVGCGNTLTTATADNISSKQGTWITAACWHNCGGRCLNKALVVDGVVVRQKSDDTHPDSPDYPQQRACLRGRSQRQQVFGADRLKYPMRRKNWAPGGGKKELRGQDEWVRISWEEALDSISGEIKRIKAEKGNRAFFVNGSKFSKILSLYGGYVPHWGTTSFGSWTYTPGVVGYEQSTMAINDRLDMRNCETVIMFGMNPAWSSAGNPAYNFLQVKKAGAKFIAVDPNYNETYALLDAEWISCRPATDTSILIAIAYTLIKEDNPITNPRIDWEYLKNNTIGFDADSMPEGSDPKDNFKDYVLGTYDGVPKTAEWASEINGIEPERIRYLARAMNRNKKVAIIIGWASGRSHNSDNLPQMVMTIGAMTGHMGKSGHMCGISVHSGAGNGGAALIAAGVNGLPTIKNPVDDSLNDTEMWPAIVNGKYNWTGNKLFLKGEKRDIDIRMIYHDDTGAILQSRDGMTKGIEAHRKVDLVVSHSHFLTTNSKYADFVLPVTTEWEKLGGFLTGNREMLIMYSQITKPMYECHDDEWIAIELAKRLGVDPTKAFPIDYKQQFFNQIVGATVTNEDGKTKTPLITITAADIAEWNVKGTPQKGRIGLKEFQEKGIYQVERKVGDNYGYIAFKGFRDDPVKNPRITAASGKMEIYSQVLADTINNMGYSKIKAIPTHIPPVEGYEATFKDWKGKVKGDYPYQVINPHYLRRSHTVFDNVQWLRETWPNPVFINAKDAKEKGITDGNTVLLTSHHGKTLRTACVTERFMPGVVGLPHGSWVDMDEKTGIDTGGADNILCGPISTGQGPSGWNSCVANIEKYSDAPLTPDVQKPQRIIL